MEIEKIDFNNKTHRLFCEFILQKHSDVFFNDDFKIENLLGVFQNNIGHSFIFFKDKRPYGLIWALPDDPGTYQIGVVTDKEHNFFLNIKILRTFVRYMFETAKANKLKCEIIVYNTKAEFGARCCGFRKEGILRGEIRKKGVPFNMLRLGMIKEDWQKGISINRNFIKKTIQKMRTEKWEKAAVHQPAQQHRLTKD
jgi:RimJ/RimL family protein N-acetyltransferase